MKMFEIPRVKASEITIRRDAQTNELCLYTVETRTINAEEHRIAAIETNVKDPSNIIRWEGRPKPGILRGWAKNYLNKSDYERYGLIYRRSETLMEVDSSFNINKLYTKKELIDLIDAVNAKRMEKLKQAAEPGEEGIR